MEKETRRLTLTDKKPFNVGSQRFEHYSLAKGANETHRNPTHDTENNESLGPENSSNMNFEGPKRVKKLIMTSVKVKVPFGTSTSKFESRLDSSQVGPG